MLPKIPVEWIPLKNACDLLQIDTTVWHVSDTAEHTRGDRVAMPQMLQPMLQQLVLQSQFQDLPQLTSNSM